MVQACRQNKNQPEREFLENGANPEIRKKKEQKIKMHKNQNYPKILAKEKKVRKTKTNKTRTKPRKQKRARRGKGWHCPCKMCNQCSIVVRFFFFFLVEYTS